MSGPEGLLQLNGADYAILTVVTVSTLISLFRGFLKEFISLFVWIVGFWTAIKFYQKLAVVFEPYIINLTIRQISSFITIFFLILILGILFNYLLSLVVVKSGLSGTDRVLGMLFGFGRGVLLVSVILLLIGTTSFIQDKWWQESSLIPHFQSIIDWLKSFLPEKIGSFANLIKNNQ